jgi:hypothetical protein
MGIFLGRCYQAESVRGKEFADVSTEVEKCIHTTADGARGLTVRFLTPRRKERKARREAKNWWKTKA